MGLTQPLGAQNPPHTEARSEPKLASVVIPTLNRHELLRGRLPAIARAGFDETIVVDSSTARHEVEQTRALCRSLGASYINSHCGRSAARNLGARAAAGRWIFFCDDDGFVFTRLDRARLEEQSVNVDYLVFQDHLVWIFRRAFLLRIGGYDEGLVAGEDDDLTRRARRTGTGGRAEGIVEGELRMPDSKELRADLLRRLRNQFEYGVTTAAFAYRHPSPHSVVRATFRRGTSLMAEDSRQGILFRFAGPCMLAVGLALSPFYLVRYRSRQGSRRI